MASPGAEVVRNQLSMDIPEQGNRGLVLRRRKRMWDGSPYTGDEEPEQCERPALPVWPWQREVADRLGGCRVTTLAAAPS